MQKSEEKLKLLFHSSKNFPSWCYFVSMPVFMFRESYIAKLKFKTLASYCSVNLEHVIDPCVIMCS